MPFPWQRACIWMKGVLIAWFWVTMAKIGKFQQNRGLWVAQLFKWLQRIALKCLFCTIGQYNNCSCSVYESIVLYKYLSNAVGQLILP